VDDTAAAHRRRDAGARPSDKDQREVLEAYRMFANSKGWMRRMEEDIAAACRPRRRWRKNRPRRAPGWPGARPLSARAAARSRRPVEPAAAHPDGQGKDTGAEMPPDPILVARNIGPGELLDYGRKLKGVVLEDRARSAATPPSWPARWRSRW
jgi:phosphotransferase system enzyme I (PtsP)